MISPSVRTVGMFGAVVAVLSMVASLSTGQTRPEPRPSEWPWTPARLPDGQPNIQGFYIPPEWGQPFERVDNAPVPSKAATEFHRTFIEESSFSEIPLSKNTNPIIVDPPEQRPPYLPWAQAARRFIQKSDGELGPLRRKLLNPRSRCLPLGLPNAHWPHPHSAVQILQRRGAVVFLHEPNHQYRVVPLDGGPHPGPDIKLWMGDSRGKWEGNTLVVDVTNFTERTWLWGGAVFHSDALHLIERFTPLAAGVIEYEATIEDPKVFSKPWKIRFVPYKKAPPDQELFEFACHEGNRSLEDAFGADTKHSANP